MRKRREAFLVQQTTDQTEKLPPDPQGFLEDSHLETPEEWLDQKFSLFGFRFGLDGIIGLIPGIGDLATTGVSAVFVADAIKAGARRRTIAKMAGNLALDFAVGAVPVAGDLFDFMFKSNLKNLRLLREERIWLAENGRGEMPSSRNSG